MIVPQYGSSKITVFVWGKSTIVKFVGNTKYKSMKLTLQLVVDVLIDPTKFRDNLFKFTLYIIIIYKVGDKRCHLGRHALIQQVISFIDLYLVFSTSFGIVFLPHKNTVFLLEPYCGTITEPGLPVMRVPRIILVF